MEKDKSANAEKFATQHPELKELVNKFIQFKQDHVFNHADELSGDDLQRFIRSLKEIDLSLMEDLHKNLINNPPAEKHEKEEITRMKNILRLKDISKEVESELIEHGAELIHKGKVAILLLSGGQGSRLGFEHAKGLYDIGMPSGKTIFEYHAYKIKRMSEIICKKFGIEYQQSLLRWYVMTSEMNHKEIMDYFKSKDFFGLGEQTIHFFSQENMPALDLEGKIILEDKNVICQAPNGNGGVWSGLINYGILEEMKKKGIEYLNIFGVDNVLAKPADPLFLGYASKNSYQIACKFVPKAYPDEKVGIHVLKNGKPNVIEYSEMTQEMIHRKDEDGNLLFDTSHIVNALYSISFLEVAAASSAKNYHLAKKKIKYYDEEKKQAITPNDINGYKFELFYFDVLPLSDPEKFGLIEVKREEEFAPVKNAPGSAQDSPDTARALMSQLHQRWLEEKGVKFNKKANSDKDSLFEIDVAKVYDQRDENLNFVAEKIKGETQNLPLYGSL